MATKDGKLKPKERRDWAEKLRAEYEGLIGPNQPLTVAYFAQDEHDREIIAGMMDAEYRDFMADWAVGKISKHNPVPFITWAGNVGVVMPVGLQVLEGVYPPDASIINAVVQPPWRSMPLNDLFQAARHDQPEQLLVLLDALMEQGWSRTRAAVMLLAYEGLTWSLVNGQPSMKKNRIPAGFATPLAHRFGLLADWGEQRGVSRVSLDYKPVTPRGQFSMDLAVSMDLERWMSRSGWDDSGDRSVTVDGPGKSNDALVEVWRAALAGDFREAWMTNTALSIRVERHKAHGWPAKVDGEFEGTEWITGGDGWRSKERNPGLPHHGWDYYNELFDSPPGLEWQSGSHFWTRHFGAPEQYIEEFLEGVV